MKLAVTLHFFSESERLELWKKHGCTDAVIANITKAVIDKMSEIERQLNEPCRCGKQTFAWCMTNSCSKEQTSAYVRDNLHKLRPAAVREPTAEELAAHGITEGGAV